MYYHCYSKLEKLNTVETVLEKAKAEQPIESIGFRWAVFTIEVGYMRLLVYDWSFITKADLYAALRRQGITFKRFTPASSPRINAQRKDFQKELDKVLEKESFDAIFSINFFPDLSAAAHDRGMLYICWTYDSPAMGGYQACHFYDTNRCFIFDSYEYEIYKKSKVPNIYYLPLAVDVGKMNRLQPKPVERVKYRSEISMVGQLYQSDMDQIYPLFDEYSAGYIAAIINTQLNIYGQDIIEDLINENVIKRLCNEQVTEALLKNINHRFLHDVNELTENSFKMFLGKAVTNKERVLLLSLFARYYPVNLYSTEKLPIDNVKSCGVVDYETEMPLVFKCSKINLNITLKTIRNGIPQRILDILACRGLALTNYQRDLEEYFEDGKNILIYHSAEEALDKVKYYLSHEGEAERIRQNGYKIVKDQFSYDRQLNKIWELSGVKDLLT